MWFCGRFATAGEKHVDPYLVGEKSVGKDSNDVWFYSIMGWNLK